MLLASFPSVPSTQILLHFIATHRRNHLKMTSPDPVSAFMKRHRETEARLLSDRAKLEAAIQTDSERMAVLEPLLTNDGTGVGWRLQLLELKTLMNRRVACLEAVEANLKQHKTCYEAWKAIVILEIKVRLQAGNAIVIEKFKALIDGKSVARDLEKKLSDWVETIDLELAAVDADRE